MLKRASIIRESANLSFSMNVEIMLISSRIVTITFTAHGDFKSMFFEQSLVII